MNGLEEKKRELMAVCDIQRQVLRVEWHLVQARFGEQWRRVASIGQAWKWAAPVAGILMARGFRRRAVRATPGSAKLWLAWKLWEWWRRRRATRASDAARETPP